MSSESGTCRLCVWVQGPRLYHCLSQPAYLTWQTLFSGSLCPALAPVCFDEGALFYFVVVVVFSKSPVNVLVSLPPSRLPARRCSPLNQDPSSAPPPPASHSPPPARPPAATLRFGLIFVLLSFFCASPCAVIYNLPLLSGLTGSSGVTALAARTASTSQSQQHDGTPQSGKRTAAHRPASRGARGRRKERARRGKTKITMCSRGAFQS